MRCVDVGADVDLHRWLSGGYVIPGDDQEGDEVSSSGQPERPRDGEDE